MFNQAAVDWAHEQRPEFYRSVKGWSVSAAAQKSLLLEIAFHVDAHYTCYPSVAELMEGTALAKSAVLRSLEALEAAGLLQIQREALQTSTYVLGVSRTPGSTTVVITGVSRTPREGGFKRGWDARTKNLVRRGVLPETDSKTPARTPIDDELPF